MEDNKKYVQSILENMNLRTEPEYDNKGYTLYINGIRFNDDYEHNLWEKAANYFKENKIN